jgi:Uma2 family endonuclease
MPVMPHQFRDWTVGDLDAVPDDGLQHELLDGMLLVSPAPSRGHQRAAARIFLELTAACPTSREVLFSPLDWRPDQWTSLQPDVLVLNTNDLDVPVSESMILAVEVLSPSTRRKDLFLKRSKYQDAGVASYWIVDPVVPSVTVLDLVDGNYVTVGEATGDEPLTLEKPYPITIIPADLIR